MSRRRLAIMTAAVGISLLLVPRIADAVSAPPPTSVVAPATVVTGSTAPLPSTALASARLLPLLRSPALGRATMSLIDAATGAQVLGVAASRPQPPASTTKVLTSIAVLAALGPQSRISTTVVRASPGAIVLVGGGDASLTRVPAAASGSPAGQSSPTASMRELAVKTATALKTAGTVTVRVDFDDALFIGPKLAAGWSPSYISTGVVSPVSALSVDSGRVSVDTRDRSLDPALAAVNFFVTELTQRGISVSGKPTRVEAAPGAATIANVLSPTIGDLVERTLTASDNDLAEALGHLAGAHDGDGSFVGGAAAVTTALTSLGVTTAGLSLSDGSGLSLRDVVPAAVLSASLAATSSLGQTTSPDSAKYGPLLSGLSVAGLTGTLTNRFIAAAAAGRGVVRAKTGTLSGVCTLAGTVRTKRGRLLTFAILARDVIDLPSAQRQIDRVAAAIVGL